MRWVLALAELALLCWFAVVGWEAFMQRAVNASKTPFNLLEFHHAYLGAAIVVIGWQLNSVTGVFLQFLGLTISIDDHCQHLVQTYGGDYTYRSPLHLLFASTLWRVPGIPWLTRTLDSWWLAGAAAGVVMLFFIT